jgi:peptidoglycan-associated lipoprotein
MIVVSVFNFDNQFGYFFTRLRHQSKLIGSLKSKQRKDFMKKLVVVIAILSITVGCKSLRNKSEGESTGTAGVDTSPVSFAASGSDSGSIEGLQTVFFDYDTSKLSGSEKEKLSGNVQWMKKNSSAKLAIEGHCDQRGSNEYNLSLGERRANTIKQMMQSMGVSANRLTTVSFGEEKPLVQGETEEAMMKNRRANFVPGN